VNFRFGIGSLSKPFTAVAAMRLVETGRLRLSDSICTYVRVCPNGWRPVTLENLLSHTSGIPDLFSQVAAVPVDSMRSAVDAVVAKHQADALQSEPGEKYAYSNFGYFLMAYAMEAATGRSWSSILRTEVFDRAGTRETEYDDVWRVMSNRVRGYATADGSLRLINYHDHGAWAAGGLLSSAADLLRFDQAFESGRLVSDSSRRAMMTPRKGDYGLGWQIITAFGQRLRNHTGGTNGYTAWLGHFDDGTAVIILSNIEESPAKSIGCDVAALVFKLQPSRRGEMACRPAR
jgi:CubicO group peptidase (beta-lactamase class C family)